MNYTPHYNLRKPELAEQFDLADWNYNTDAIDSQMFQNKTDINTIITALTTKDVSSANTLYSKMMKLIYPVGSLYWSSNSTNPAELFGGTWTPIKDKFVWAKGDNDTVNATGGEKTHTLTTAEMPSHTHTFTGSAVNTGAMSRNSTGSSKPIARTVDAEITNSGNMTWTSNYGSWSKDGTAQQLMQGGTLSIDVSHTHSVTAAGTNSNTGSGTAHNNMPPYIVKYCWERTA